MLGAGFATPPASFAGVDIDNSPYYSCAHCRGTLSVISRNCIVNNPDISY
jgi:hypothetical protein